MKYLDLSFPDPAANLACDEALLELFESERPGDGILRVWESPVHFIVLGHSNRFNAEVHCSASVGGKMPVLRRVSGGGTVMQGPGCFNYSLVLNSHAQGLTNVRETFRYVLQRHAGVIASHIGIKPSLQGISDLTVNGRKFSGNAQYRKSRFVLVHGTFLLQFDLSLAEQLLKMPPKQPDYRGNRPHLEFITNLNLESARVRDSLRSAWNAREDLAAPPTARIQTLIERRYGQEAWLRKF